MRRLAVTVVLLSLVLSSQVFGQSTNATVSGTVQTLRQLWFQA